MSENQNHNDDPEREIILDRIKEDLQLQDLREEVDQLRQSQAQKQIEFLEAAGEKHPHFAELAEKAKRLFEVEGDAIDKRRLGYDHHIEQERESIDIEDAAELELEGDPDYLDRMEFWKEKLNYDRELPEIDPSDEAYRHDLGFHNTGSERTDDFRNEGFVFGHESRPDSIFNQLRLESYEFWKQATWEYPPDLIESELKTNLIHPVLDFRPNGLLPEADEFYEAERLYLNIQWRTSHDRYDDESWRLEYQKGNLPRLFEIGGRELSFDHLTFENAPRNIGMFASENAPFLHNTLVQQEKFDGGVDPQLLNQYREELEQLYDLSDDEALEDLFQLRESDFNPEPDRDDDFNRR